MNRVQFGQLGEKVALDWYLARGYELVARNWRPYGWKIRGELDLILRLKDELIVVEVKTRRQRTNAIHNILPLESITAVKQRQIRKLAQLYSGYFYKQEGSQLEAICLRCDVVGVTVNVDGTVDLTVIHYAF